MCAEVLSCINYQQIHHRPYTQQLIAVTFSVTKLSQDFASRLLERNPG